MTSSALRLPAHITGAQPTGAPDTLRTVRPTFLAPSPTDTKATAHAVGAHIVRLPRTFEARASMLDGVPVLLSRNGRQVHILVDSIVGVVEVVGWNAEQIAGVHEWLDDSAVTPETESDLSMYLSKLGDRTGGRPIEGKHLTASEAARLGKVLEADRLLRLSASIDPNVDNTYAATKATTGDAREVERLVALAATLDDGASSGDAEVDRLARLAAGLSDG